MDFLDEFVTWIKTGEINGKKISGYWIDAEQKWICPKCFEYFLGTIAPCTDESEFKLFTNECDSCNQPLISIADE